MNDYVKLFCIPGGATSAVMYMKWMKKSNKNVRICPLEIPGRGMCINEPKAKNFNELMEFFVSKITSKVKDNEKYMILGNSSSGVFAFELCRLLELKKFKNPEHLFICVTAPPNIIQSKTISIEDINMKPFLSEMIMSFFPEDMLSFEDLKKVSAKTLDIAYKYNWDCSKISLKSLFDDVTIKPSFFENNKLETVIEFIEQRIQLFADDEHLNMEYKLDLNRPFVTTPLTVIGATEDIVFNKNDLLEWKQFSKGEFDLKMLNTGHMVLFNDYELALNVINEKIIQVLSD